MRNTQKPELVTHGEFGELEVHSVWPTIQGEGPFAGEPAVFVRLAGCNIQCPACDTEYTSQRLTMRPEKLVELVSELSTCPRELVVFTGGEPLRQRINPAVELLLYAGHRVQIETNGTLFQHINSGAVVVCSPKGQIHECMGERAQAFKYVISAGEVDPDDGLPRTTLGRMVKVGRPPAGSTAKIYVQPLDTDNAEENHANLQECLRSVRRFGYTLSVQIHKIIGVD